MVLLGHALLFVSLLGASLTQGGSWLETFLALTHSGAFSRFFSGESYYLALLWGVEGRTRNSWFIQPTAIWGHDMVFSRSPFLPPRQRHYCKNDYISLRRRRGPPTSESGDISTLGWPSKAGTSDIGNPRKGHHEQLNERKPGTAPVWETG